MHYFLSHRSVHLKITGNEEHICRIEFLKNSIENPQNIILNSMWKNCVAQLSDFLKGELKELDFPISFTGTSFQKSVWAALMEIPFGQTLTYGELAKLIGNPKASRAIGGACNKNPLPLIIPCHRIVSASGQGGFAGGEIAKNQLLTLESNK